MNKIHMTQEDFMKMMRATVPTAERLTAEDMEGLYSIAGMAPLKPEKTVPLLTMNVPLLADALRQNNVATLRAVFEAVCEEYRKRLCERWEIDIRDTCWIPENRAGQVLSIVDGEFSMGMEDVRLFVEHGVSYTDFLAWWDYNLYCEPEVNAWSWFVMGRRPENEEK